MDDDILIDAKALTKSYRIWESPAARLKGPFYDSLAKGLPKGSAIHKALAGRAAKNYRDFFALKDISFSIKRGEATGIIGRNGSGKSTLLQMIAGTLTPTSGQLTVNGRVSALLELGSGFNPDFTGRENVFLNGALFGLNRSETQAKFPEIESFADIGDFIEQPVKTYSSGMMMRLAFAVAITMQPDILIIDEALSVGDVFFTQKCFQRIREIVHRGATLIFVSHDMGAVQNLCDRALLLNKGDLLFDGAPEDCVSRYFNLHQPEAPRGERIEGEIRTVDANAREAVMKASVVGQAKSRHGERALEILAAAAFDGHGSPTWDFEMMHRMSVRMLLKANAPILRPSIGLQVHDRMGNLIFAAGTTQLYFQVPSMSAGQEIMLEFRVALSLQPGPYTLSLDAAEYNAENPNIGSFHDRIGGLGPITVGCSNPGVMPFYGAAQLPMEISYL